MSNQNIIKQFFLSIPSLKNVLVVLLASAAFINPFRSFARPVNTDPVREIRHFSGSVLCSANNWRNTFYVQKAFRLNSKNRLNPMLTLLHSIEFQQSLSDGKLIYWAGLGGAVLVLNLSSKAVRGFISGAGSCFLLHKPLTTTCDDKRKMRK